MCDTGVIQALGVGAPVPGSGHGLAHLLALRAQRAGVLRRRGREGKARGTERGAHGGGKEERSVEREGAAGGGSRGRGRGPGTAGDRQSVQ